MDINETMDTSNTEVQPQGEQGEANVSTEVDNQPATPLTYEIDGIGSVTPDDIKEWKQGALRQSDYTRKTQELAKQKKEAQEAIELYEYLKNNPQIAQELSNGNVSAVSKDPVLNKINPLNKQYEDLSFELASLKLDGELNRLKSKYDDFDDVAVLEEADRLGVADLEFVYNSIRGKNIDSLKEQIAKQVREELTSTLEKNNNITKTIVNHSDKPTAINSGLSDAEKMIAAKMGLSESDYLKSKV